MRIKLVVLFLPTLWHLLAAADSNSVATRNVDGTMEPEALIAAESSVSQQLREVRDAYIHGKITQCDVAKAAVEKATLTDDRLRRFVLLKGAIVMYCRAGDFESAERTYVALTNSQEWLTAEMCNCALNQALLDVSDNKAAGLCAIMDKNMSLIRIKDISGKLHKDPENVLLHRKLGEQYATIGNWKAALTHFRLSGGEFARAAEQELSTKVTNWKELGDFWWLASDDKADLLHEEYRIHARTLYEKSMKKQSKEK